MLYYIFQNVNHTLNLSLVY